MPDWYFRGRQGGLKACPGCRNLVRATDEYCPHCARRLRPEGGLRAEIRRFLDLPFLATKALLACMGLVFLLQMAADFSLPGQFRMGSGGGNFFTGFAAADPMTYIRMGSNLTYIVYKYGEYWRFFTACFLHFGILHILFNSWAFWDLGRLAEKLWGGKQVFATFILTGIFSFLTSYLWHTYVAGMVNSAGASGAICGVLGLMLGSYANNRWQIGQFLGSQLVRWAVMILVFGLVAGADNAAHVGGMVSGAALGYFLPPTVNSRNRVREDKIWTALAVVALIAALVCLGFGIAFFARGPEAVVRMLH